MADMKKHTSHPIDRSAAPAPRVGEHAIVIGGSMAGLLAARVLSESFDRVTVLDRDTLPDGLTESRRAVPQGRHAHGLQPAGQEALERLFPGFKDEALAAGAPPLEFASEFRFRAGGHLLPRVKVGPEAAIASRPLLEGLVRRRVRAIENVTVRDRCGVLELLSDNGRVTGVRAQDRAPGSDEQLLRAELVVAASGRGGRVPAWLASMGYERPVEECVDVDVLYASRHLRLRPGALGGDKVVLDGAVAGRPRGIAMPIEEGDRWNVTLYGYGAEHHPPTDDAGWKAFAATVADPEVLEAIEQAEPLDEIVTHGFPASVRRRYERLRHFPEGLLVTGDALCSFNPIYGQGMCVATLEAVALQRCLRDGDRKLARRFFKAASGPVDHAWKLATGADLAMPEVPARAALPDRIVGRYMDRLLAAAAHDEEVARTFIAVTGMLQPLTRLLHPAMALRVLRGGPRRRRATAAVREQPVTLTSAEATGSA